MFFIQIVQCLTNRLGGEELPKKCEVVEVLVNGRVKWKEYKAKSVCADLYELLQTSCILSSTGCELYGIYSNAGRDKVIEFSEKIRAIVKAVETRAGSLKDLFEMVFAFWNLDVEECFSPENVGSWTANPSGHSTEPRHPDFDIFEACKKFAKSRFGDYTPASDKRL